MLIYIALFGITLVGLGRSALIVMGYYKDPILRTFEQYGPDERLPLPVATLAIWFGAFLVAIGLWIATYLPIPFPLVTAGLLVMAAGAFCFYNYSRIWKWYYRVIPFPRWHHQLLERTTRYERRRIAFMWLHLPWRLRLIYNSSDPAFFVWADFVIIGTIREEESDIYDERFYAGR